MTRRTAWTAVAATAVLLAGPAVLARAEGGVRNLPPVSDAELTESVRDIELTVRDIEAQVVDVAELLREGSDAVVRLRSDILFAFGKATIPPAGVTKVGSLVADIPKGAAVAVYGHTDSIGSMASNQQLSEARAEAVAAVIRASRPDLRLDVRGYGETQPIAPNETAGKDNPAGRAENRRVEIRYVAR